MFCKYCGNQLDDDAVFCAKCGEKVTEENIGATQTQRPDVIQKNETQQKSNGNPSKIVLYMLIAAVLFFVDILYVSPIAYKYLYGITYWLWCIFVDIMFAFYIAKVMSENNYSYKSGVAVSLGFILATVGRNIYLTTEKLNNGTFSLEDFFIYNLFRNVGLLTIICILSAYITSKIMMHKEREQSIKLVKTLSIVFILVCGCVFAFIGMKRYGYYQNAKSFAGIPFGATVEEVKRYYPKMYQTSANDLVDGETVYRDESRENVHVFRFYKNQFYWTRVIYDGGGVTMLTPVMEKLKKQYGGEYTTEGEWNGSYYRTAAYRWYQYGVIVEVINQRNTYGKTERQDLFVTYWSNEIQKQMNKDVENALYR